MWSLTKTKVKVPPWDFVIDLIFKTYGSKEFYAKFRKWMKRFTPEITKQWQSEYMNWVGICSQDEFFSNIIKWKAKFAKEYPSCPIDYETVIAHILPVAAPVFFEQDNTSVT